MKKRIFVMCSIIILLAIILIGVSKVNAANYDLGMGAYLKYNK